MAVFVWQATCEQVMWCMHAAYTWGHVQESYGGEDAYFISEAGGGALGVADGVGGWQESGINPAGTSKAYPPQRLP